MLAEIPPIEQIQNDVRTMNVITGRLAQRLWRTFDVPLDEVLAWAVAGIIQVLDRFDVSRVGNNPNKNLLFRYIINTGYRRAIDAMREAKVIGRIRNGRYGGPVLAFNESSTSYHRTLESIQDHHGNLQGELIDLRDP